MPQVGLALNLYSLAQLKKFQLELIATNDSPDMILSKSIIVHQNIEQGDCGKR